MSIEVNLNGCITHCKDIEEFNKFVFEQTVQNSSYIIRELPENKKEDL